VRLVYKTLLRLYPRDYAELFAAEMLTVFEEANNDRLRQGSAVFLRFAVAELMGLVSGAGAEWIAKSAYNVYHSGSYVSGCRQPDPLRIRPAGVSYFAARTAPAKATDLIDEAEMCVNAYQKFVYTSPLRSITAHASTQGRKDACLKPSRLNRTNSLTIREGSRYAQL
jgi:hypothetical protein